MATPKEEYDCACDLMAQYKKMYSQKPLDETVLGEEWRTYQLCLNIITAFKAKKKANAR